MLSRFALGSLLLLTACTGDDPSFGTPSEADGGSSGGTSGGTSGTGGTGGTSGDVAKNPTLTLEGQPLSLVAGASDVLSFKVKTRQDVGELAFTVKGLPEGVSAPSVVTLGAEATSLLVPLTSVATAKHGDVAITVEADGGFRATAKLVVRGTPGAPDTGFGTGGTLLLPMTSTAIAIGALADERVVVGTTVSARVTFYIVDVKGENPSPASITSSRGNALVDLAPTADGGFVALVKTAASELELVWFTKAGVEAPSSVKVSTNTTRLAKIAATPRGTLFAQGDGDEVVTVKRYAVGQEDATFTSAKIASEESAKVIFLGGTTTGEAWVGFQKGYQQEALAHVGADGVVKTTNFLAQEACSVGGVMGDDAVARCVSDGPTYVIRRFGFVAGAIAPVAAWGVGGVLTYGTGDGTVMSLQAPAADRLYVGTSPFTATLRIDARDAKGASRTVFAANGKLDVKSDDVSVMTLDARGRVIVASHFTSTGPNVRLGRYWD